MKKIIIGLSLLLVSFSLFAQSSNSNSQAVAFIRDMYNHKQYEHNSFLRKHCTKKMLKKLSDNYDYECYDGACYACWLFRSGAQDERNSQYKIISIVAKDAHWYAYTALDMGWKFTNWIYLIKSGNTFLIDDVKTVYTEF